MFISINEKKSIEETILAFPLSRTRRNSFPHDYCFVVDYHSLANKKQAYNFLYKLAKKVEQNNKKKYQNNGFVIKSSPLEDELKFYIFRTRKG